MAETYTARVVAVIPETRDRLELDAGLLLLAGGSGITPAISIATAWVTEQAEAAGETLIATATAIMPCVWKARAGPQSAPDTA